jgi:nucleotide-binding universal stress UspA family protein
MKVYERILVATDGSSYSEAAVDYAIDLARKCDAKLMVIHVATIDPSIGMIWENVKDIVMSRQGKMLEKVKEEAEKSGVNQVETILTTGIPSEKIVEAGRESDANIIILGSHGHTKIGKVVIGSVSERVAGTSKCPVLIINKK